MQVHARLKHLRMSPRKVRMATDLVRSMSVVEALEQLDASNRRAARPVSKLIRSAVANAEHNFSVDPTSLRIAEIRVDGGPVLKRFRPKAMGRAAPILRRSSHIHVVLEGERGAGSQPEEKKSDEDIREVAPEAAPAQQITEKTFDVQKKQKEVRRDQKEPVIRKIFKRKSI